ncbi:MAG: hypothetical protein L0212_10000 [Acidobacteria bacterium]|nr:hypothetical protein [Acidobacteriota bacterium]
MRRSGQKRIAGLALVGLLGGVALAGWAAELTPKAAAAFDDYARETEARMAAQVKGNSFLWLDTLPEKRRQGDYARLKRGEVVYEELETRKQGSRIRIPDGMAHHWLGAVFIPEAKLERALAVVQDCDRHGSLYQPLVRRSKLLDHKEDHFKVSQQIYNTTKTKVAFNVESEVHLTRVSPTRALVRSRSTRIAELTNPDQPGSPEKPVGNDRGYLWRYNTYWRLEEKDGGVYVELESIALSRSIPAIFRWLVNPTIRRIRRDSAQRFLTSTRAAVKPTQSARL